jgi:hypothetical protein
MPGFKPAHPPMRPNQTLPRLSQPADPQIHRGNPLDQSHRLPKNFHAPVNEVANEVYACPPCPKPYPHENPPLGFSYKRQTLRLRKP